MISHQDSTLKICDEHFTMNSNLKFIESYLNQFTNTIGNLQKKLII